MHRLLLDAHLSDAFLKAKLDAIHRLVKAGDVLLVDCSNMPSFDADARTSFTQFLREHGDKLARVAVVSNHPMYRMIISTMALAVPFPLKAFDAATTAEAWLTSPSKPART